MSKPVGRPRVPKKLAKGALLSVRFSEGERKALDRAAGREGIRLSEWARKTLLAAARAEGGNSSGPSSRLETSVWK